MPVYLIANIQIDDRERYAQYEAGFMAIFERYPGKILAVDEEGITVEGEWPATRTVLLEFPDQTSARAWYESDDYQDLVQHRFASSRGDMALIRGIE